MYRLLWERETEREEAERVRRMQLVLSETDERSNKDEIESENSEQALHAHHMKDLAVNAQVDVFLKQVEFDYSSRDLVDVDLLVRKHACLSMLKNEAKKE